MTLTLAAAQTASVPGDVPANLEGHLRFCDIAAEHGVRLLVFPELSLTGYEPTLARANALTTDDPVLHPLRLVAETARMTVVAGAPVMGAGDELHLAALVFRPDGSVHTYAKEHLHAGEERFFVRGRGGLTLPVADATVALAICADTTHPEHPASAAARGATVYAAGVLITEDGYACDTAQMEQYAREHRMAVLMANHGAPTGGWVPAGKSAIWSEDGGLVAASPGTDEALVIASRRDGVWSGAVVPA